MATGKTSGCGCSNRSEPKLDETNYTTRYAADYEYEPFRPGAPERATYCRLYNKDEFEAWRSNQSQLRDLLAKAGVAKTLDESSHPFTTKDVRLKKPKPVAIGVAICDMVSPNWRTAEDGFSKKELPPDYFERARGRKFALLSALRDLQHRDRDRAKRAALAKMKSEKAPYLSARDEIRAKKRAPRLAAWEAAGKPMNAKA